MKASLPLALCLIVILLAACSANPAGQNTPTSGPSTSASGAAAPTAGAATPTSGSAATAVSASATPAAAASSTPALGAALQITSPAFAAGASIPAKYTCQGDDSSPALAWSAPPTGTKSLALIMDDPDAPSGTWVHWVVYNLPPDASGLAEGASKGRATSFNLPQGTIQGKTSFGRADYGGPCPPSGQHRYFFHLYALDIPLTTPGLDKAGLLKSMEGHILAQGELMGVYKKQ